MLPSPAAIVSPLIAFLFASMLCAQAPVTVHAATPGGTARPMDPWSRGIAATADGAVWVAVHDNDGSGTAAGQRLVLFRSTDGGATWQATADTSTVGDGRGSIAAGPRCDRLHVVWNANDGTSYQSLYHQEFDTAAQQWVGTPQQLIQGQGSNDQYYAMDVEVTAKGSVVVGTMAHRSPTTAPLGAWSAGLLVRPSGQAAFQGPFQANVDSYGVDVDLQAVGEVVHGAFRTATGGYGIRYRAFDTESLSFVQAADVALDGANQGQMRASNANCIAADGAGNLYVLYAAGGSAPGSGELRLAYAAAGSAATTWNTQVVAVDADLLAGNVTYRHFTLARVGTDTVFVVYSRLTGEQHQSLYARAYVAGTALSPEFTLIQGATPDRFRWLNGLRSTNVVADLWVASSDFTTAVELTRFGGSERVVRLGTACEPAGGPAPQMRALTLPVSGGGNTFDIFMENFAPNAAGIVFAGDRCQLPVLDLTSFGLSGCELHHDVTGSQLVVTTASGTATASFPIPANPSFAGIPLYLGSLALIPGANPAGAVVSNSLMVWVE